MGLSTLVLGLITLLIIGVTYMRPVRKTISRVISPFISNY